MSDGRRGAAGPPRSRYAYDPAADPGLYAGVLSRRVVAFVFDAIIVILLGATRVRLETRQGGLA